MQTFKGKQVAAKKGFDLLKSKSDALKVLLFKFYYIVKCLFRTNRLFPLEINRSGLEISAKLYTQQK